MECFQDLFQNLMGLSMSVVKKLDSTHWIKMGRLRSKHNRHAGGDVQKYTSVPLMFINDRYKSYPNCAYGYFDDNDQLKAFLCAYSFEDFWVVDLMVSSESPKHLQECLKACILEFESRGIYKFYYAFPAKWARAYKSFWRDSVDELKKYKIEDLCILEAKKRPNENWIWEHILHEFIMPVNLLLRLSYVEPSC